jgi:3-phosphoshikimate 1-carboxyvinyltransferase
MILKRSVSNATFSSVLEVPSSKSYANRIIILATLCQSPVKIINLPKSSDVKNLLKCLKQIGVKFKNIENGIEVINSFPQCEEDIDDENIVLETGDGGTTNRFLIPLLALGKKRYIVEAEGGMRKRPMKELEKQLKKLECNIIRDERNWFSIKGPIKNTKELQVDCSQSTQFATGLALALSNTNTKVIPKGLESSQQYFELTENLIALIRGGRSEFTVPVDASSLSYPLALGLVSGGVEVSNAFEKDALQADSVFLDIIQRMNGEYNFSNKGLRVSATKKLNPIDIDCSAFPDLVPTLAFVCSKVDGVSFLRNIEVLRYKESDRVAEILKLFDLFHVKYDFDEESSDLKIIGSNTKIKDMIDYTPAKDHRMVMVAYLFMRTHNGGQLGNYQHVAKSFDNFFEVMES